MDRRTAVRRLALAAALPVIAPTELRGLLDARRALVCVQTLEPFQPKGLSQDQLEMVKVVADLILPTTSTPGATDVGVHEFIDLIVSEWFDVMEAERFLAGLTNLDTTAAAAHGLPFLDCAPADQLGLVAALDQEAATLWELGDVSAASDTFFYSFKRLTLTGYFTSEEGAALIGHRTVPGRFEGCLAPEPVR